MNTSSRCENSELSVLLPIYAGTNIEHFQQAITSVQRQSFQNFKLMILIDGPINEVLNDSVTKVESQFRNGIVEYLRFDHNRGLGLVLQSGLDATNSEYVARVDCDDINVPHRFFNQMEFLERNPEIDVVGSFLCEFDISPAHPIAQKRMPESHDDIVKYARTRNPVNHPSVIFRRSAVIESGGYRHMPFFEDYDLWIRMLEKGYKFHNIGEYLVNFRISEGFYTRRKGPAYIKHQHKFLMAAYQCGFFSYWGVCRFYLVRLIPFLMPASLHRRLYKLLRRSK